MTRVRTTSVWFNLPGVVAAYQPIGAPDPFAARFNVMNDARSAGTYTCTDYVAGTKWKATDGWIFNNVAGLETGIYSKRYSSWALRWSDAAVDDSGGIFGQLGDVTNRDQLSPNRGDGSIQWANGQTTTIAGGALAAGVAVSVSGSLYLNGVYASSGIAKSADAVSSITLGYLSSWGPQACKIQVFADYSRILNATEIKLVSTQLKYCHVNPDWSAWGRRRRYYYAQSNVFGRTIGSTIVTGAQR